MEPKKFEDFNEAELADYAKIGSKLLQMYQEYKVPEGYRLKLARLGLLAPETVSKLAVDKESLKVVRTQIANPLGLKPDEQLLHGVAMAGVMGVVEACQVDREVQLKADAERKVRNVPREISVEDVDDLRWAFEQMLIHKFIG